MNKYIKIQKYRNIYKQIFKYNENKNLITKYNEDICAYEIFSNMFSVGYQRIMKIKIRKMLLFKKRL